VIRSSNITVNFSNTGKKINLSVFLKENRRVAGLFIDLLWELGIDSIPEFLPKEFTNKIAEQTWLSARDIQSIGKQVSGIVRGTKTKQAKRQFMYEQLLEQKKFKQARRLLKKINETKVSKPVLKKFNPELDSRFVKVFWKNPGDPGEFDGWLILTCLGDALKLIIPLKKTKHFNKMLERGGVLKPGIRISEKAITFIFDIPTPPKKTEGRIIGIDIGLINTITTSEGFQTQPDKHGHTLRSIVGEIARKKKGSKGFEKACRHRKNFINWSWNQLDLTNVRVIKLENIKNINLGKRTSRLLKHWTCRDIFDKGERISEDSGVQTQKTDHPYTSQRCSPCGWVQKSNRKRKKFKCKSCDFTWDSDLNAAVNIRLDLKVLPKRGSKGWRKLDNRKGFYWLEVSGSDASPKERQKKRKPTPTIGSEHIVPDT
jgi:transposase